MEKGWLWVIAIFISIIILGVGKDEEEIIPENAILIQKTPKETSIERGLFTEEEIVDLIQPEEKTIPKQETETIQSTPELKPEPKIEPEPEPNTEPEPKEIILTDEKWYTSSHQSAKYYYHESCQGWQGLSLTYLKVFSSEEELLNNYNRMLHPKCNY